MTHNKVAVDASIDFDTKVKKISGPINVVRLAGTIHGTSKVIYLFMDRHETLYRQTGCDNVYADNIRQYMAKQFSQLNNQQKKYDFFLELTSKTVANPALYQNNATMIFIVFSSKCLNTILAKTK